MNDESLFKITMNNKPMNSSEALARLQASTEYAARPPQPQDSARGSERVKPMSDSYRQAVEEFRLWMENTKGREDDFKNERSLRRGFDNHNI